MPADTCYSKHMNVSESIQHLCDRYSDFLKSVNSDENLIGFIAEIRNMQKWLDKGRLDLWEMHVQDYDIDWDTPENKSHFDLAVEIFEFGRFNLYSAFQPKQTRDEYNKLCVMLQKIGVQGLRKITKTDLNDW